MFNCWYVIVIALSIYHEVNAEEKLTRQCAASQGRCAKTKDSNCESSFGSGWINNGSCCRRKPCCVYIDECATKQDNCDRSKQICENLPGTFKCTNCPVGKVPVDNECRAATKCPDGKCRHDEYCHTNTETCFLCRDICKQYGEGTDFYKLCYSFYCNDDNGR
ncbi:protein disulfide isomerase Creld2-like [Mytilus edulis]|uniref:protein disulfide isomerase Creld2-like n=1 Tax=Mytilus edulis TaxID=6550 RepID=UPI0039EED6F3